MARSEGGGAAVVMHMHGDLTWNGEEFPDPQDEGFMDMVITALPSTPWAVGKLLARFTDIGDLSTNRNVLADSLHFAGDGIWLAGWFGGFVDVWTPESGLLNSPEDLRWKGAVSSCDDKCAFLARIDASGAEAWMRNIYPAQLPATVLPAEFGGGVVAAAVLARGLVDPDQDEDPISFPIDPDADHDELIIVGYSPEGRAQWITRLAGDPYIDLERVHSDAVVVVVEGALRTADGQELLPPQGAGMMAVEILLAPDGAVAAMTPIAGWNDGWMSLRDFHLGEDGSRTWILTEVVSLPVSSCWIAGAGGACEALAAGWEEGAGRLSMLVRGGTSGSSTEVLAFGARSAAPESSTGTSFGIGRVTVLHDGTVVISAWKGKHALHGPSGQLLEELPDGPWAAWLPPPLPPSCPGGEEASEE